METLALTIAGVGAAVLGAGVWAWWRHRDKLNEVQQRLTWNEQSRFALERHAHSVDIQLAAMSQALQALNTLENQQRAQPTTLAATRTATATAPASASATAPVPATPAPAPSWDTLGSPERRQQMHAVLARADASAAAQMAAAERHPRDWADTTLQGGWQETEPMPLNGFADTLPAELAVEERTFPKRRR